MTKQSTPPPVAYQVITEKDGIYRDDDDDDDYHRNNVSVTAVELTQPARHSVHPAFAHIPEAAGLSWTDDYFDDAASDDIIAVFDWDYDAMESYYTKVGWACLGVTSCLPNMLGFLLLGGAPCFLRPNVQWHVRNLHVAVTVDGIRFVHEKHQTCWGFPFSDVGRTTKTIPFDKIVECDLEEPAGNACLCIARTLRTVNIDTMESSKALQIAGLRNPVAFKNLVLAMKRNQPPPTAASVMARTAAAVANQDNATTEQVATLLKEIRDELRLHNQVLQQQQQQAVQPSAPIE